MEELLQKTTYYCKSILGRFLKRKLMSGFKY